MALYPAPATLLVPSLILDLALAVWGGWRMGGTQTGDRLLPSRWRGAHFVYGALAALLVFAPSLWLLFGAWDRQWPVLLGLLLGLVAGLVWEGWRPGSAAASSPVGPAASGLAAIALLALVTGGSIALANAALGLLLGWGVLALLARLRNAEGLAGASTLGLGLTALAGGAAAWGEKLAPMSHLGAPLAVGVASALVVALLLAELVEGSERRTLPAAGVGFVVFALASAAIVLGVYSQPLTLYLAILAGAALGVLAPLLMPDRESPTPLGALILLVAGGGLLVLDNRLMGILGLGLGGVGLALGARGASPARPALTLLLTVFAARVWMQLFLDRTLLTSYGIDLTHPYAFAALVLGGLLPLAAVAIARLCNEDGWLLGAWALVLALLPAWVGYFLHVEPLASLLAGLVLASFLLGTRDDLPAAPLAPPLLIVTTATTLLAAPWLVTVMNATRQARMLVLVAGFLLLAVAVVRWYVTSRRVVREA